MRPVKEILEARLLDAQMREARARGNLRNKASLHYENGRVAAYHDALELLEREAAVAEHNTHSAHNSC